MNINMTPKQIEAIKNVAARNGDDPDTLMAKAQPTFGCDGAVALPWCGMWLCIETDGYTHS